MSRFFVRDLTISVDLLTIWNILEATIPSTQDPETCNSICKLL